MYIQYLFTLSRHKLERMYVVERDMDSDMYRVLHMVQELSEQLAHNQKLVSTLQSQAGTLKACIHIYSPYPCAPKTLYLP